MTFCKIRNNTYNLAFQYFIYKMLGAFCDYTQKPFFWLLQTFLSSLAFIILLHLIATRLAGFCIL